MRRPFAHLLVLTLLLAAAPAVSREELTVEALWQLARLGPMAASPDGDTLAATVSHFDFDTDKASSRIWLFDRHAAGAPRAIDAGELSATQPRWHPDGRQLFFLGTPGDGTAQLHQVATERGKPVQLTDLPVAVTSYRIVEGGAAIVFEAATVPGIDADFARLDAHLKAQQADATQAKISDTRILRYWDRYLTDGRVPHLFRLDLADRAITDLMPGFDRVTGFEGFEWDVAADGRTLVYAANSTRPPYRELDFDIFLREVGGEERNLTDDNPADDVKPVLSPDGMHIAYGRTQRPGVPSDFVRPMLLDRRSGRVTPLAGALDGAASDWRFAPDGQQVYFHAERAGQVHLYRWQDGRVRRVAGGGVTSAVEPVAGGAWFVRQDFSHPPDAWFAPRGKRATRITALNDASLRGIRFGTVQNVTYRSGDAKVQMFVARPAGRASDAKLPAVILSHGGPFSAWTDGFSFRWHPALLAARGYVVAMPNFRGSTGFGQEFADAILGNHGEKPAADTIAAADWLVAHANVDPQRIALAGGSYGGYLTALLTGLSDRFTAAVVHAGVYDIGAQFASDSHWTRPSAYGDAPWTDPVRLNAWSPSRLVPSMNTPTLILHGEMDYRVPVTQGINLHGALSGKGVPSRIVVFPREHHWIVRPQAARLWWHEVFAWLDRWNGPRAAGRAEGASAAAGHEIDPVGAGIDDAGTASDRGALADKPDHGNGGAVEGIEGGRGGQGVERIDGVEGEGVEGVEGVEGEHDARGHAVPIDPTRSGAAEAHARTPAPHEHAR